MRPETLLDILRQGSPEYLAFIALDLRRFACWCARDAGAASAGALPHRVLHAAEKYAEGKLPHVLLAAERRSAAGLASGAGTIGLARRQPSAALQLAAIRTADEDPYEAARGAAHYSALAVELRDGEAAGIVTRPRQVSALRFYIPNPFIREGLLAQPGPVVAPDRGRTCATGFSRLLAGRSHRRRGLRGEVRVVLRRLVNCLKPADPSAEP